jgi:hypothetical protein
MRAILNAINNIVMLRSAHQGASRSTHRTTMQLPPQGAIAFVRY